MFLLEKVQARLLAAETDSSLSAEIHKFLPPCLLKLASGQEGVRKRVMELLVHINKRIKTNDNIQLPIETLLVQYQVCYFKSKIVIPDIQLSILGFM